MLLFYELAETGGAYGLFSPIRSKRDAISNMFKMIKRSSWSPYTTKLPELNDYFAYDRKLGRAFIRGENNVQSIAFPFRLWIDKHVHMASASWKSLEIGADVASLAISVLNEANDPYVNLVDSVRQIAYDSYQGTSFDLESIAYMLSDLVNLDDGYFRHDHDPEHANGSLHPIDHIDIYHSDSVSLKIGVKETLSLETVRRMINKEEAAFYLDET